MLIEAFKSNSSICQVAIDPRDWDEWSLPEAYEDMIIFYSKHNKQIHAILAAPTDNLLKLRPNWPRIFLDVRVCAMEASILLVALAALGDAVGPPDDSIKLQRVGPGEDN